MLDPVILEMDVRKWSDIEMFLTDSRMLLTEREQFAFSDLKDYWRRRFNKAECEELIARLKSDSSKHPNDPVQLQLATGIKNFASLCTIYYTKTPDDFFEFAKALGNVRKQSRERKPPHYEDASETSSPKDRSGRGSENRSNDDRNSEGGVTIALIAANVLAYLAIGILGGGWISVANPSVYQTYGASNAALTVGNGEWWRLGTSMFLHLGVLHLIFNMLALFTVGIFFEKLQGRVIYTITYFTCGIFGGLVSIFWHAGDNILSASASGAVFGIYGSLLGFMLRSRGSIPSKEYKPIIQTAIFVIGYNLFYGLKPGIDNSAHIGGLVCGFLMGLALAQSLDPQVRRRRYGISVAGSLGLMVVFIAAGLVPWADYLLSAGSEQSEATATSNAQNASRSNTAPAQMSPLDALRQKAEQGDVDLQVKLGVMYFRGQDVTQDYSEAANWIGKAAGQGHAGAQNALGYMYQSGQGVSKDDAEAAKWYRKAADQNLAAAQFNLGIMYENGRGVPKDELEALKWYRKAAAQGNTDAQQAIASMTRDLPEKLFFYAASTGAPAISINGLDVRWGSYEQYLRTLIDAVRSQWIKLNARGKGYYMSVGAIVTVKFRIDSEGRIVIISADSNNGTEATNICKDAITDPAPYVKWTDEMKAMFGDSQEMVFTFFSILQKSNSNGNISTSLMQQNREG